MRQILTWGLVAAVAAVGLAAGIDALRDGEEPEPVSATESEPTTSGEIEPAESTLAPGEALRAAGAPPGRLVYADESCGVHALVLPDLGERPVHDLVACQGLGLPFAPPGGVRAECAGGRLTLWAGPPNDPELYARERGCGAAARPDGTVTFVQDGNVRRFTRCPGDGPSSPLLCSEPVLTRGELSRQLHSERFSVIDPRIKEHAWLDDQRLAVIFGLEQPWVPGSSDLLVLFDRGRLVRAPFAAYEKLGGITPSPTGSRVAAFDPGNGDILVVDDAGGPVPLASYEGHAIAWSPDESWVAVATDDGIDVFRADGEGEPIRIPVAAHDLLWLDATDDAGDALARAGDELRAAGVPAGTLTYADEDCQSYELALPELVPVGSPNGFDGNCRYRAVVGGLVETAGPVRSPDWTVTAECEGGRLSLWRSEFGVPEPQLVGRARGCGAAWKPDETVTFVQDGGVRRFVRCPGDGQGTPLLCSEPVLTRDDLHRELEGGSWRVKELHWLGNNRLAAIVSDRGADSLAIFDRGRIVRGPVNGFEGLDGLRPSPQTGFVAAYERSGTIVIAGRAGRPVHLPVQRGRGVAWSPNEEWVAVATEGGIYVFRMGGRRLIRIPVIARDLLWSDP